MYDFAHALSDAIEGITHSLCTLEFEDHRPLYDWCVANCTRAERAAPDRVRAAEPHLHGDEQAPAAHARAGGRGRAAGTIPRMPTICGLRRRGYTPEAIRDFAARIGVAKRENLVDVALLEDARPRRPEQARAAGHGRAQAAEGRHRELPGGPGRGDRRCRVNPEDPAAGTRTVPFSRELYIERDDFMEEPPKKFFRLAPGREVRLRGTYFVTCQRVVKNDAGEIVELRCTYDPATRDGNAPDGRKAKATIHWVSAAHAVARRGAALRSAVHQPDAGRRGRRRRLADVAQPGVARGAGRARSSRRWPRRSRATGSSSSGSATSAWIRTRRRDGRCSTGP